MPVSRYTLVKLAPCPFTATGSAGLVLTPGPGASFLTGGSFDTFFQVLNFMNPTAMFGQPPATLQLSAMPSPGGLTAAPVPGGFVINSFFDIFTELSIDGGMSWSPVQPLGTYGLQGPAAPTVPEPGSLLLLGSGVLFMAGAVLRRRRR